MNSPSSRYLARGRRLLGVLTALLAGSYATAEKPPKQPKPIPTIIGQEDFFDGRILAELRIAPQPRQGKPAGPDGEQEPGSEHRGHGGFHGGMGGSHGDGPEGRHFPGGGAPGEERTGQRPEPHGGMHRPPLEIHLRFTNQSDEKIEVFVADFLSPLGNFVVQPEKFILQPHQVFEVEPMTSLIGDQMRDGKTVLTLKVGTSKESKPLELKLAPEAAPPADKPKP